MVNVVKQIYILKSYALISLLLILIFLNYLPVYAEQAQAAADVRIVVLISGSQPEYREALAGFEKALQAARILPELVVLDDINVGGSNDDLIARIYRNSPDLIFALGTSAASKVRAIRDIPIVYSMVLNTSFMDDGGTIARNNTNITGVTLTIPVLEQFTKYKEIFPKLRTVGVIYNPDENAELIREAQQAARARNIELIPADVKDERGVPRSLRNLIQVVDVLWLIVDKAVNSLDSRKYIFIECFKNNIPVMALSENRVRELAAFAVTADYEGIGWQSGEMAKRIFRGVPPSAIPVESPHKLNIYINKRIIDSIGLEIPDSVLKNAIIIQNR